MYLLFFTYFVIGAVIGSFLNVCIYRLPEGRSIVTPPSACGNCGHRLGALDMIPIFSYFLLRGRCRYCGKPYSCRYALIEFLTGILFLSCGFYFFPGINMVLAWIFIACLIVETFVDIDHQIILDEILLIMLPLGLIYAHLNFASLYEALYGALFAGGLMLIIFLLSRGGMGAGDVKLAFILGIWLGFQGAIVCIFLAFLLGGIIGVILLATKLKTRKDPIPFGPFLCFSAYISLLFSPYLVYFYWSLFA